MRVKELGDDWGWGGRWVSLYTGGREGLSGKIIFKQRPGES